MKRSTASGLAAVLLLAAAPAESLHGRQAPALSPAVQPFVAVPENVVALVGVRVIDGTGSPARDGQTVVLRDGRIEAIGPASTTRAPSGARVLRLDGHTVIPGLIGLHDHMYYSSAAGGSMKMMLQSYPRLFLAAGVTTIRTTGAQQPYAELNLKREIDAGRVVESGTHAELMARRPVKVAAIALANNGHGDLLIVLPGRSSVCRWDHEEELIEELGDLDPLTLADNDTDD